jgi:hypothetical protein
MPGELLARHKRSVAVLIASLALMIPMIALSAFLVYSRLSYHFSQAKR